MKPPNCTLSTACFDLSPYYSGSRKLDITIQNMAELLATPCYLVIYADSVCMPLIKEKRNSYGLHNITKYVDIELNELNKYEYISVVKSNREKYYPTKDERACAEGHIVQISKVDFVLKTMETNPFQTTKFGWIDANLGPSRMSKICENYENNMLLYILNNITDKFHIQILNVCDKKYKESTNKHRMYDKYRWIACGCLFTMSEEIGKKIIARLNEISIQAIVDGYGHGEESTFLEILDEFYDDIERSYGDYYNILNNFIRPTKGLRYIYKSIIKRYEKKGYHRESYDCCKIILKEFDEYNLKMDYDMYFSILYAYYVATYYYKGKKEAKQLVDFIMQLVETNSYIKNEFNKEKDFYASNFSLCN